MQITVKCVLEVRNRVKDIRLYSVFGGFLGVGAIDPAPPAALTGNSALCTRRVARQNEPRICTLLTRVVRLEFRKQRNIFRQRRSTGWS